VVIKAICTHARKTIYGICKRELEIRKHSSECVVEKEALEREGKGRREFETHCVLEDGPIILTACEVRIKLYDRHAPCPVKVTPVSMNSYRHDPGRAVMPARYKQSLRGNKKGWTW
jgi:hypothetical protein